MPGKAFVNYRRDDARDMAARIRDRLAAAFGDANVFMDVDNLLAGQRFDRELEKALDQTDVLLAVIGPGWLELLAERADSGERDYVRAEIAGALQRGIVVIPVLIERTPLPRADALPGDIRDLVLHHKHVVSHEQFGRDLAGLIRAIREARKAAHAEAGGRGAAVRWIGAAALAALLLGGGVLAYQSSMAERVAQAKREEDRSRAAATEKARQEEIKRAAEAASARKKAEHEAQAKRAAAVEDGKRAAAGEKALQEEQEHAAAAAVAAGKADEDAEVRQIAADLVAGRPIDKRALARARSAIGAPGTSHSTQADSRARLVLEGYGSRLTAQTAGLFKIAVTPAEGQCSAFAVRASVSVPSVLRSKGYALAGSGEEAAIGVTVRCDHYVSKVPGHAGDARRADVSISAVWKSTGAEYAELTRSAEGYVLRGSPNDRLDTEDASARAIHAALVKLRRLLPSAE
jgi:hypothetical protein